MLLPEGASHSERLFFDVEDVPAGEWPVQVRHRPKTGRPELPAELGNIDVQVGPGIHDDGMNTYDSLTRGLPSMSEYFRGRNVAMHRVVRVTRRYGLTRLDRPVPCGAVAVVVL